MVHYEVGLYSGSDGLEVSMLDFYSDDTCSSLGAVNMHFSVKCYLKGTKMRKKRPELVHSIRLKDEQS